jgi:phospholipid transport system transporter-binding protein
VLLLPDTVGAPEARDTLRRLSQALAGEPQAEIVLDASALRQFDSSALAVLLECQRLSQAAGKPLLVRGAPPKLHALAKLYGVDVLLCMGGELAAAS